MHVKQKNGPNGSLQKLKRDKDQRKVFLFCFLDYENTA